MIDRLPDEARAARLPSPATRPVALRTGPWSARSAGPAGVTAAGALWALKEQQPGDVPQTWADVSHANKLFGYEPTTSFKDGVTYF